LQAGFAEAQIITTVAGNGIAGYSGDGGLAISAQLNTPSDVFKDAAGSIYIADRGNNRIRKISPSALSQLLPGTGWLLMPVMEERRYLHL